MHVECHAVNGIAPHYSAQFHQIELKVDVRVTFNISAMSSLVAYTNASSLFCLIFRTILRNYFIFSIFVRKSKSHRTTNESSSANEQRVNHAAFPAMHFGNASICSLWRKSERKRNKRWKKIDPIWKVRRRGTFGNALPAVLRLSFPSDVINTGNHLCDRVSTPNLTTSTL